MIQSSKLNGTRMGAATRWGVSAAPTGHCLDELVGISSKG